jgi:hypothetical protein
VKVVTDLRIQELKFKVLLYNVFPDLHRLVKCIGVDPLNGISKFIIGALHVLCSSVVHYCIFCELNR